MKLSISLGAEDLEVLDAYARAAGLDSRSAAIRHAIQMLRHPDLEQDYEHAWDEWETGDDASLWDTTVGDGLPGAQV